MSGPKSQGRGTARRFARPVDPQPGPYSKPPAWIRAAAIPLTETADCDDAVAAVIAASRDHWQANLAAALDGRDPEGIHQVRVGLRRLRSALSLFKKRIPAAQRVVLNQEAKWLLGQLSAVRDLDVFINVLAARFAKRVSDDENVAALIRIARALRERAQAEAATALCSARARRFATRLDTWVQGRGWRTDADEAQAAEPFARKVLNRRLRKIRQAADNIASLPVDDRHELRIAVKKARYGIEFFSALLPAKRAGRWTAALKDIQDSLGHLNDLDVADRTVTRLVENSADATERRMVAGAGRAVSRLHKKASAAAEPETRKYCRRLKRIGLF